MRGAKNRLRNGEHRPGYARRLARRAAARAAAQVEQDSILAAAGYGPDNEGGAATAAAVVAGEAA